MNKNIFLTGDIQVGKTTILNYFLNNHPGISGGFKTVPYFLKENIKIFELISINNFTSQQMEKGFICQPSHDTRRLVPIKETFEDLGVQILQECLEFQPSVIIMDELGIFESQAIKFQEMVYKCLASPIPVLGVIKNKENHFLNKLRERNDVLIMPITLENRELQRISFFEYCGKLLSQL